MSTAAIRFKLQNGKAVTLRSLRLTGSGSILNRELIKPSGAFQPKAAMKPKFQTEKFRTPHFHPTESSSPISFAKRATIASKSASCRLKPERYLEPLP